MKPYKPEQGECYIATEEEAEAIGGWLQDNGIGDSLNVLILRRDRPIGRVSQVTRGIVCITWGLFDEYITRGCPFTVTLPYNIVGLSDHALHVTPTEEETMPQDTTQDEQYSIDDGLE